MKKLTFLLLITLSCFAAQAQVYRLENLTMDEAGKICDAVNALSSTDEFWENDTLPDIIKSAKVQIRKGSGNISLTLNKTAMLKVIQHVLRYGGGLRERHREKERLLKELNSLEAEVRILQAIRKVEVENEIPDDKSMFEQLNTGFLKKNNIETLIFDDKKDPPKNN